MSQLQLLKIRIKPGMTENVVGFIRGLGQRHNEVTDTFLREGMRSQSFFLERHSDGDWLYYLARADDLMQAALAHEKADDLLTQQANDLVQKGWADIHAPELLCDLVRQDDDQVRDELPVVPEFNLAPLDIDEKKGGEIRPRVAAKAGRPQRRK